MLVPGKLSTTFVSGWVDSILISGQVSSIFVLSRLVSSFAQPNSSIFYLTWLVSTFCSTRLVSTFCSTWLFGLVNFLDLWTFNVLTNEQLHNSGNFSSLFFWVNFNFYCFNYLKYLLKISQFQFPFNILNKTCHFSWKNFKFSKINELPS